MSSGIVDNNNRYLNRRSIRLKDYDYTKQGAYYITACTSNRENIFGEIADGKMILNEYGKIVCSCWEAIPARFPNVESDEFIVMPNHIHGIIFITTSVGAGLAPALNNNAPALNNNAPALNNNAPALNNNAPALNNNAPALNKENIHIPDTNIPNHNDNSPEQSDINSNSIYSDNKIIPVNNARAAARAAPTEKNANNPASKINNFVKNTNTPVVKDNHHTFENDMGVPETDVISCNTDRAAARAAPTIGNIVGAFKSIAANECLKIFKMNNKRMGKIWQRNYYEHIIRDNDELNRIRQYIMDNPAKWDEDEYNPAIIKKP